MSEQFGDYEVLEELGFGGTARVHRARWLSRKRFVALKRLHPDLHPEIRKRFLREIRVISKLSHPNIVSVDDFGEVDGVPYLAMRLVEGPTLSRWILERAHAKPVSIDEFHRLARGLVSALVQVHAAGVVHRDLKPANVFVDRDGEALLADFGLAQIAAASRLTPSGDLVGTPAYLTPEQMTGRAMDARSDLYQAGLVFYELLTGALPFSREPDGLSMSVARVNRPIPLPSSVNPAVPSSLDRVVLRCLAVAPEDRHPSAAKLLEALEGCQKGELDRPVKQAPAPSRRVSVPVLASPHRPLGPAALAALVALGLCMFLPAWNAVRRGVGSSSEQVDLALTVDPMATEAMLSFITDEPLEAVARLDDGSKTWEAASEPTARTHHSIKLLGLAPSTSYRVWVELGSTTRPLSRSRPRAFTTAAR